MSRRAGLILGLGVLLTISWAAVGQKSVNFADDNLEKAIRETVFIDRGAIYDYDVAWLTEFSAADRDIEDLEGLQYCTSLATVILSENAISNLTPLRGASALVTVQLDQNDISDIDPLGWLTNLRNLNLMGNDVSDISALSALTRLETLDLWDNVVENLSPQRSDSA